MDKRTLQGLVAAALWILVAGCTSIPKAPLRESYASDGSVSAEVLNKPSVERYQTDPGTTYRGSNPSSGNAVPQYPPGLLSRRLPPATLVVRVIVDGGGVVTDASVIETSSPEPAFADALLSTVGSWTFIPLTRVTGDKVEALPFTREYRFTFQQVNGHAVVESAGTRGK